ncbi:MAG TPA: FliM/FliN family flagellar motor C-terminal domain-containing protein [Terriglobia bacterium]|nr:FliM/FliN family flagellar motor C-terminal domain-containing protein [Terriglobia bacterium]
MPREIWAEALELPCHLSVALEVPHYTVRDLLGLTVNSVVDTRRREGAHVPVLVNGVMVGWAEFDVIDGRLAVRMTEMV